MSCISIDKYMRIQKVIPGLVQTKENYWSKAFVTHIIIVHYCKLYLTVQQSYMEIRYIHGTYTHSTLLYTVQYCTAVQYWRSGIYMVHILIVHYCTLYNTAQQSSTGIFSTLYWYTTVQCTAKYIISVYSLVHICLYWSVQQYCTNLK